MYPTPPRRLHLMLAAGALLILVFVQQQRMFQLPATGRVAEALPDAIHGAWFACVTWVLLLFVSRWTRGRATVAVTAMIGFCIAVGTELLQKLTGGDAEVGDVVFDMIGMGAALSLWSARRNLMPAGFGIGAAAVLLIGSTWPAVHAMLVERYRDSIAPELIRFDSRYTWNLIRSHSTMAIEVAPSPWSVVGPALKITLADEKWAGVHLDLPIPDWSAYSALDVDVFVDAAGPMPLTISVRLDNAPVDHVFQPFVCAPGPCRLHLPLDGLFDRDVARVNDVVIHSQRSETGRVLYLGRVALSA